MTAVPGGAGMDAAVEAAALGLYPGGHHERCNGANPCGCYFQRYRIDARRALTAALPYLSADRDALAAEVDPEPVWLGVACALSTDSIPLESVDVPGLVDDMLRERAQLRHTVDKLQQRVAQLEAGVS